MPCGRAAAAPAALHAKPQGAGGGGGCAAARLSHRHEAAPAHLQDHAGGARRVQHAPRLTRPDRARQREFEPALPPLDARLFGAAPGTLHARRAQRALQPLARSEATLVAEPGALEQPRRHRVLRELRHPAEEVGEHQRRHPLVRAAAIAVGRGHQQGHAADGARRLDVGAQPLATERRVAAGRRALLLLATGRRGGRLRVEQGGGQRQLLGEVVVHQQAERRAVAQRGAQVGERPAVDPAHGRRPAQQQLLGTVGRAARKRCHEEATRRRRGAVVQRRPPSLLGEEARARRLTYERGARRERRDGEVAREAPQQLERAVAVALDHRLDAARHRVGAAPLGLARRAFEAHARRGRRAERDGDVAPLVDEGLRGEAQLGRDHPLALVVQQLESAAQAGA
eukprot:scaffold36645_cov67-Phaeocystis_antarctica.AAC.1